ncbi:DNA polymerase I [Verrucomicrobiales bacterium BCK34]|nr:DNA polymerase I [Verrucomicrobiales bacterium BCK34]
MAEAKKRIFLLDGMALIYRAHFALIRSPIYTSARVNTSALFGFTNTLLDLLEKQKPTHLAVAFDTSDPTPRHEIYPEYKANRDAMPEDLALQLPHVKRLVEAFNIPVIECPGWEADDIIGTLSVHATEQGDSQTYMVTPDKDFAQLVNSSTLIYKPGRQGSAPEILDEAAINENWQVENPLQTIDILGLWGDASDNIPGIPGIGEKTARKLIAEYGSIENLLANTDKLKGKQKENVENNREQALLSKQLVTIMTDAPVGIAIDDLLITERNDEAIQSLFVEFEFNGLGKRLYGDAFQAGRGHTTEETEEGLSATLKTIKDFKKDYTFIRATEQAARTDLIKKLSSLDTFCFDLETTSLDEKTTSIIGIAFSWNKDTATYVEIPRDETAAAVLEEFRALWQSDSIVKIGHNLKFDIGVLTWQGYPVASPVFDTMLAHSLIEPDQRHKMDYLAESLLGYTPIAYDEVFTAPAEKSGQLSLFDEAEMTGDEETNTGPAFEQIAEYACEDADITWQLAAILKEQLNESGQEEILSKIECPLVPVLVEMEKEGIRLDPETLAQTGVLLAQHIAEYETSIYKAADTEFNLNSPKQVGEILFDKLQLVEKPKKTKTGQYKTDEQTLTSLAAEHEIVRTLLTYREAAKLKNTYVDALPNSIFEGTGRVHTTFHQLMTATGRLASNNPNLQNIPIRSEQGREIRRAFVPRNEAFTLLAADYSQIELRVMASLCEDEAMMDAFREGKDIHTATAARVFQVPEDEVISEMRRTAKMVNFGIIYGISAFGLSQRLNGDISRGEAGEIIKEYFRQYPRVKEFQEKTIAQAQEDGYVETLSGRRRYLRDINSRNGMIRSAAERTAINTPIQGTAADMIKIAMVKVADLLRDGNYETKMLLQVHDELVFDLHRDEQDELIPKIEEAMKIALPLSVPILVESGTGDNWLEAH